MDHNIPLITTVAVAFGLALILGFAAVRLKLPALVGYRRRYRDRSGDAPASSPTCSCRNSSPRSA